MVNYACAISQTELGKYFESIIKVINVLENLVLSNTFSDFKYFFALAYGYFDGNLDSANEFNNMTS